MFLQYDLTYSSSCETDMSFPGARAAGKCTCDRAKTENEEVSGPTCDCGKRAAGM